MTVPARPVAPVKPTWTLADVTSGKRDAALRLCVMGIEGVGKSTFAAGAPAPIFLGSEDGSLQLDVKRMPKIGNYADALHGVELLRTTEHPYKTLVIDTLDWLEPMLWRFICQRDGKKDKNGRFNIEAYGYGKGYDTAVDEWRRFFRALEPLREKDINVVLLAHTHVKTFKNPEGPDYDRYELKVHQKAAGPIKEWCDAVLFANQEIYSVTHEEKDRKGKGLLTSQVRYLYTERTAAYDAKNRYGLPAQVPLSWDEFQLARMAGRDPKVLLAQIEAKTPALDEADRKKVAEAVVRANGESLKLSQLLNYVNARQPAPQVDETDKDE